jgi:hypothetical protein
MLVMLGFIILAISVVAYVVNRDIEEIRYIKNCDVLDASYCFDCKHYKKM